MNRIRVLIGFIIVGCAATAFADDREEPTIIELECNEFTLQLIRDSGDVTVNWLADDATRCLDQLAFEAVPRRDAPTTFTFTGLLDGREATGEFVFAGRGTDEDGEPDTVTLAWRVVYDDNADDHLDNHLDNADEQLTAEIPFAKFAAVNKVLFGDASTQIVWNQWCACDGWPLPRTYCAAPSGRFCRGPCPTKPRDRCRNYWLPW